MSTWWKGTRRKLSGKVMEIVPFANVYLPTSYLYGVVGCCQMTVDQFQAPVMIEYSKSTYHCKPNPDIAVGELIGKFKLRRCPVVS